MLRDVQTPALLDKPGPADAIADGSARVASISGAPSGRFVRRRGRLLYEIDRVEAMAPFLMVLAADSDLWMYLSSRGPFTAGRGEPDRCVFAYETDDRLHRMGGSAGPVTLVRFADGRCWRPLDGRPDGDVRPRVLRRSPVGDWIEFEETDPQSGLSFRAAYSLSDGLGVVRRCELRASAERAPVSCDVIDGYVGVMPACVPLTLQQSMSTLVDAYKRAELAAERGPAIYSLEAAISDSPEAAEVLRGNIVWHTGLDSALVTLDEDALAAFERDAPPRAERLVLGRPGAYLLRAALCLVPGSVERWAIVADVHLGQPAIVDVAERLGRGITPAEIDQRVQEDHERLGRLLDDADGAQLTADIGACAAHRSNVLFNAMRGGVPVDACVVDRDDFMRFVQDRHRRIGRRGRGSLSALPKKLPLRDLVSTIEPIGDPQLVRLSLEYLPLTFGRRHGDPSRPWNRFRIRVRTAAGERAISYEGNWRDIFQNWEATCRSYPAMLPAVIAKFVNASTVDGHNPYRISERGIDWEIPQPEDPRSSIGYWGDHQIVYLLRLLELCRDTLPEWTPSALDKCWFSYANVPYRLRPFREIAENPKSAIRFDRSLHARLESAARENGSDACLVLGGDGEPVLVTLMEKLLVAALAKISNLVPEGGVWMNTQRPEWNDANNALAGNGLSVVTACHLRRFFVFLEKLLAGTDTQTWKVSPPVAEWVAATFRALSRITDRTREDHAGRLDDAARLDAIEELGLAAEAARDALYGGAVGPAALVGRDALAGLFALGRGLCESCIRGAKRDDGLYESYRVLRLGSGGASFRSLGPMLEGQVAALSCGLLGPDEACDLLDSLFASTLYCERRRSFMLYPKIELAPFLERNIVPPGLIQDSPLLQAALEASECGLLQRDARGAARFCPDIVSHQALSARLAQLRERAEWTDLLERDSAAAFHAFESTFNHSRFTGRSGRMHKYEGIGSIYWHMVSKLLLATQECVFDAKERGAPPEVLSRLRRHYFAIRDGLGYRKTPAEYGAVPHEPYSHSPWSGGAQQPGMTGQVKEGVLTRFAELGVRLSDACIRFDPVLVSDSEYLPTPSEFRLLGDDAHALELPAGTLAFTLCATPVRLGEGEHDRVSLHTDRGRFDFAGRSIPRDWSEDVLFRSGRVRWIDVKIARAGHTSPTELFERSEKR